MGNRASRAVAEQASTGSQATATCIRPVPTCVLNVIHTTPKGSQAIGGRLGAMKIREKSPPSFQGKALTKYATKNKTMRPIEPWHEVTMPANLEYLEKNDEINFDRLMVANHQSYYHGEILQQCR